MAQTRLDVRIYRSVAPGVSDKDARAYTRPMLSLLEEQLDLKVALDLDEGQSPEELYRFGERINKGAVHLGVIWGLEYGWLHSKFKRLEPLLTCAEHEARIASQFVVHEDFPGDTFGDLQNKRLATFPKASLMDRVYLHTKVKQNGYTVQDYFKVVPCKTVRAAIQAVNRGDADCVVLNYAPYGRYVTNRPGIQLRVVVPSKPIPEVVLTGRRDLVDDLRRGLWEDIEKTLQEIHLTAEGQQCVDFWRIERFKRLDDRFERLVRERLRDYPITVLAELE